MLYLRFFSFLIGKVMVNITYVYDSKPGFLNCFSNASHHWTSQKVAGDFNDHIKVMVK